jgi:hypothetical protein
LGTLGLKFHLSYIKFFVYCLILPFYLFIYLQTFIYFYISSVKDSKYTTIIISSQRYRLCHLSCKSPCYEFFHYALTATFCLFISLFSGLVLYPSTFYFLFTVMPTRLFIRGSWPPNKLLRNPVLTSKCYTSMHKIHIFFPKLSKLLKLGLF